MKIVGRNTEQELLRECLFSGRPEFLAVYGRRRVGKTFLMKEYFENSFHFMQRVCRIKKQHSS